MEGVKGNLQMAYLSDLNNGSNSTITHDPRLILSTNSTSNAPREFLFYFLPIDDDILIDLQILLT